MLFRSSYEPQLLKMDFEPSLSYLAVRARPQTGSGREVEVGKGHIGDGEMWSVGSLNPTSLRSTGVGRSVRDDQ